MCLRELISKGMGTCSGLGCLWVRCGQCSFDCSTSLVWACVFKGLDTLEQHSMEHHHHRPMRFKQGKRGERVEERRGKTLLECIRITVFLM